MLPKALGDGSQFPGCIVSDSLLQVLEVLVAVRFFAVFAPPESPSSDTGRKAVVAAALHVQGDQIKTCRERTIRGIHERNASEILNRGAQQTYERLSNVIVTLASS